MKNKFTFKQEDGCEVIYFNYLGAIQRRPYKRIIKKIIFKENTRVLLVAYESNKVLRIIFIPGRDGFIETHRKLPVAPLSENLISLIIYNFGKKAYCRYRAVDGNEYIITKDGLFATIHVYRDQYIITKNGLFARIYKRKNRYNIKINNGPNYSNLSKDGLKNLISHLLH